MRKKGPIDRSTHKHICIFFLSFYFSLGLSLLRIFVWKMGPRRTCVMKRFSDYATENKDGLKASDHVPVTNHSSASLCQVNENTDPHNVWFE